MNHFRTGNTEVLNNLLEMLEAALKTWAVETDNEDAIAGLRETISTECNRFIAELEPDQVERCLAFLGES